METKKAFSFNGVPLNPGDVIHITPLQKQDFEIGMVVLDLLDETGTSLLVLLQQSHAHTNGSPMMELKESEILSLRVMMEAHEAVVHHSRERFTLYQRIIFREGDGGSGGKVIGAYDGLVAAELNLGDIVVRDAEYYNLPPPTSFDGPLSEGFLLEVRRT